MKILVVGATGTIGKAVVAALGEHEVHGASRHGTLKMDLLDALSIDAVYEHLGPLDAVVCAAGEAKSGSIEQLSDAEFAHGLQSKLMGQVNLVRRGLAHLREGGSFILTGGQSKNTKATCAISLIEAALEGFVRTTAAEMPRGLRLNLVCPSPVRETLERLGREANTGLPAAELARTYVSVLTGNQSGQVVLVPAGAVASAP